jgi:hypothetical protein
LLARKVPAIRLEDPVWVPETPADRTAIQEQSERVLADPSFCRSKRDPGWLRYVVGRALSGHTGQLKEATSVFDVFGGDPDYSWVRHARPREMRDSAW